MLGNVWGGRGKAFPLAAAAQGASYATPFAWGRCPQAPGMGETTGARGLVYNHEAVLHVRFFGDNVVVTIPFTLTATKPGNNRVVVDRVSSLTWAADKVLGRVSTDMGRYTMSANGNPVHLEFLVPLVALQTHEQERAGTVPRFQLDLHLGLIEVVTGEFASMTGITRLSSAEGHDTLEIPREKWLQVAEKINMARVFVLEAPLSLEGDAAIVEAAQNAYHRFLEGLYKYAHISTHKNAEYSQSEAQMAFGAFMSLCGLLPVLQASQQSESIDEVTA